MELRDAGDAAATASAAAAAASPQAHQHHAPAARSHATPTAAPTDAEQPAEVAPDTDEPEEHAAHPVPAARLDSPAPVEEEAPPPSQADGDGPPRLGPVEGFRILEAAFTRPGVSPRFPMYVRQVKQYVRQVDENFDERKYGFTGMVDALRYGQREGLFRLDRDRQGVVRVYPGLRYPKPLSAGDQPGDPAASEPQDVSAEHRDEFDGDAYRPIDAGDTGNGRPDSDAEAAPDGRDTNVDAVTYDVVTHVDADSGVIDVARHEDAPPAADGSAEAGPAAPAPARTGSGRRRRPAGPKAGGRPREPKAATPAAASTEKKPSSTRSRGGRGRKKPGGEPSTE